MPPITGLDFKIREMAGRIRALRELENLSFADMAAKTGVSVAEYSRCEAGESDLNFAFIYRCALALNVNVTDIIEGHSPHAEILHRHPLRLRAADFSGARHDLL